MIDEDVSRRTIALSIRTGKLTAQGKTVSMASRPHRQIVSPEGWISHDLEEIYQNVIACVKDAVDAAGIGPGEVAGVGLSNQLETTAVWHRDGTPYAHAVVWQCARAANIARHHAADAAPIQERTGLRLSPSTPPWETSTRRCTARAVSPPAGSRPPTAPAHL